MAVAAPAAALDAAYEVLPNGTAYRATIPIVDTDSYELTEPGLLGEKVPLRASDIRLTSDGTDIPVTPNRLGIITFPRGNYTLEYTVPIQGNHLAFTYQEPSSVEIRIPPHYRVENPIIGIVSEGGNLTRGEDNATVIRWDATQNAEVRFYEEGREALLSLFVQFWTVTALIMLLPYLLTYRRKKGNT